MIDVEKKEPPVETMTRSTFVGERWKESVTRARVLAPYAATSLFRSAWWGPDQSWMQQARPNWARSIARESSGR